MKQERDRTAAAGYLLVRFRPETLEVLRSVARYHGIGASTLADLICSQWCKDKPPLELPPPKKRV